MARALIVGCGCRGRELGARLVADGWAVRGTSRGEESAAAIRGAGLEAAIADPALPGTVLDLVADVAVVHWLLGSADGPDDEVAALHGQKLERILERLVDTPVRGFVYEASGTVRDAVLRGGAEIVARAAETWRIPVEAVAADPFAPTEWVEEMAGAASRVISGQTAGGSK
jgi:nucleoside-diphosphate-sugar epimerase